MTAATIDVPLDLRSVWQRWRLPIVVAALLLGGALLLAALAGSSPDRLLDPRDATPQGARAIAALLRDRGVTVTPAADAASVDTGRPGLVVVPDPGSLDDSALAGLAAGAVDLLVIEPDDRELSALGLGNTGTTTPFDVAETVDPQCGLDAANVAGSISFSGHGYFPSPGVTACYPVGGGAGLLVSPRGPAKTYVFGSATTFSNDLLDENGDAALALGLIGGRDQVTWLLPKPATRASPDNAHKGLVELLPRRLVWAVVQLGVVVLLVAMWRARRLGAVVVEPLPVVVRATETVEGKARLLRAARARAAAAASLREATRERLRDLLGLATDAPPAAVVSAVSGRTGRPDRDVALVLYGAEPADDQSLMTLADALDDLETAVRRT